MICLSYYPLTFVSSHRHEFYVTTGNFHSPFNLDTKVYFVLDRLHIRKVIYKSNTECFLITKKGILSYHVTPHNIHLEYVLLPHVHDILDGWYDRTKEIFYGISKSSVYFINVEKRRIECTFHGVLDILLDKYRYSRIQPSTYLNMLLHQNMSTFQTTKILEEHNRWFYSLFRSFHMEYKGIYHNYFVFLVDQKLILVNRISMTEQIIVDMADTILDSCFQVYVSKTVFLFTYEIQGTTIKTTMFTVFPSLLKVTVFENLVKTDEVPIGYDVVQMENIFYLIVKYKFRKIFLFLFDLTDVYFNEYNKIRQKQKMLEEQMDSIQKLFAYPLSKNIHDDCESKIVGKCCICYDYNVSTCFFPCGHVCVCGECANSVFVCPLCRSNIMFRKKIFISSK